MSQRRYIYIYICNIRTFNRASLHHSINSFCIYSALDPDIYTPLLQNLHIPPASNPNRLPINIREPRRRNTQNCPRSLLGSRRSAQRDIRVGRSSLLLLIRRALLSRKLLAWNSQGDLRPIRRSDESAFFLGGGQTGRHEAEGDGIRPHAERRTPFFGDCTGQADNAGFRDCVIGLASVLSG